jgi:multiple sugar transport system permease protein
VSVSLSSLSTWWAQQGQVRRRTLLGYLFLSPWLLGLLAFTLFPILAVFGLGFMKYGIFGRPTWIGIQHYRDIFTDDRLFLTTLGNTLYFVALSVPLSTVIGFLLAVALNTRLIGQTIFRTAFYVPSIVPQVAAVLLFVWLFHPQIGLINFALDLLGLEGPNWLGRPQWAKPAIVIMGLWGVGGGMIIYLAGLQSIPQHLYEAAEIDGATEMRRFLTITIPMMTPTLFYNLVIGIIGSFQVFVTAYVATQGGPLNSTLFYVLYLYRYAFEEFKLGYASAMAWILFLLVLALTVVVFRSSSSWVYYESGGER